MFARSDSAFLTRDIFTTDSTSGKFRGINSVNRTSEINFTTRVAQNTVANKGNQHFLLFFTRTRRRVHLNHRGALNYKLYSDNYTGGTRVSKMRHRRACPINKSRDNEDKSSAIRNAAPLFLVTRRCN